MNIVQGIHHKPRPSWAETIWTWILAVAILFPLAWFFAEALVKELENDERKMAHHIESILYRSAPDVSIPSRPQPQDLATPKTKMFQDASERVKR
jgi:hypothetical protein